MFKELCMKRGKHILIWSLLAGVLLLFVPGRFLGGTSGKHITAVRVSSAPTIDGKLTENQWALAEPVSEFQQYDPVEGAEPTERTSVRVLYDDNALYVGVMCYDSNPQGIVHQLTRRDRSAQSDRIAVIIDSYHDHSTAFLFSGSVSGVQSDGALSHDGLVYDIQWDAVWEFNAQVVADGWSAEFKIPFSALRFVPLKQGDSGYVWGINFRRYIARKNETDEWVMVARKEVPPGTLSSVSKMGHLLGINDIHPPLHLEVLPYESSKLNYISQPDPFPLQKDFKENVGLDLKYGVSNNLTLDVAVNPDFGQVEVDQAILNLTVFETFYPEKRPFFLEGAPIFSFGNMFDNQELRLFYSRRIGKRPAGYDTVSIVPNPTYSDMPELTTILAAGKLTGRTEGGLTLGVLSAVTNEENATVKNQDGSTNPATLVEPRAGYNVLRLKQDVFDNSWVGLMATSSAKEYNSPALSGGVDWNLRFDENTYAVDGYLAGSQAVFDPLYPSGNRVTGDAGRIGIGKLQGEHWLAFSLYDFTSKNFWIDDLGFYSQPREHGGFTQVSYKEDRANTAVVQRYALTAETDYRWDWDQVKTVSQVEFEPQFQFTNFWTLTLDYLRLLPAYDDINKLSYGGVVPNVALYHRPAGDRLLASLQTDSRQPVVLTMNAGYQNSTKGMSTLYSVFQFTLRPSTWMEFDPSITLYATRDEEAWPIGLYVYDTLNAPRYNLFGDRDVDETDLSLRGTITFTRNLSVQFFTQVLLAKGHYANLRELVGSDELMPYYSPPAFNPDFNEKTINANLVLRWEYMPGSTFYLVWTQSRFGYNSDYPTTFGDDFRDAFKLPMDNVLLAKITYWWSR
jgi:hypothetical protein